MNKGIFGGWGMGDVLYLELQGDNMVRDVEMFGKMKSKCFGYFCVLDLREMLLDMDCLGKMVFDVIMGKLCYVLGGLF